MLADSSRALLDAIADPALLLDPRDRIVCANAAAHRRFGRSGLDCLLAAALAPGAASAISLNDATGETFQAEVRIAPAGDELRLLTVRDVTAQHRVASQLADAERIGAQREAILDHAGEGVCGLDPDGLVTFANPAAARILGTTVEEIVGSPFLARVARTGTGAYGLRGVDRADPPRRAAPGRRCISAPGRR
jgi:PAS domain-containing protein